MVVHRTTQMCPPVETGGREFLWDHLAGCGCNPCRKSTAFDACEAAENTARVSLFSTLSHESI